MARSPGIHHGGNREAGWVRDTSRSAGASVSNRVQSSPAQAQHTSRPISNCVSVDLLRPCFYRLGSA